MTTGQGLCQRGLGLFQAIVEGLCKESYMNSKVFQGKAKLLSSYEQHLKVYA